MEIPAIQGLQIEKSLLPLERPAAVGEQHQRLRVGVPSEAENDERRVALAPYAAGLLVANGHEVRIEAGAGEAAQFADTEYAEFGCDVVEGAGAAMSYSHAARYLRLGRFLERYPGFVWQTEFRTLAEWQRVFRETARARKGRNFVSVLEERLTGEEREFWRSASREVLAGGSN